MIKVGFQEFMLPLLKMFKDEKGHTIAECVNEMSKEFNFSDEELSERLPSGKQNIVYNRITWALQYLKFANLLNTPQRGTYFITDRGVELLQKNIDKIDIRLLEQYEEFNEARKKNKTSKNEENYEEDYCFI